MSDEEKAQTRQLYWVLAALMTAMVLAMLDGLIVGTAMPTIVAELGGLDHLSWVVTAYTLATAASTPIWGKLGDMYGRKGVYLTSIVIFLAGSALAGMAQSMGQLIALRALQGLGGGGLLVGALAIIGDLIPMRERGRYQGMLATVMGVSMVAGPLVGGVITDHLGWRWAFYINLPIGAVALIALGFLLHLPKKRTEARIDYLGALLLTVSISSLVLLATWGGTRYGWGSAPILGLAALGLVTLAAFVAVERRAAEPVIPLRVFRSANFSLITVVGFLAGFVMFGAMTFLPVFQQTVQGASATNSGLLLLPVVVAMTGVGMVGGRRITESGRFSRFVLIGSALMSVGLFLFALMGTETSRFTSGLYMLVYGAGAGFITRTTLLVSQNNVEAKDLGVASSTATLIRTIGGAFGVSIMGTVFTARVQDAVAGHVGGAGSGQGGAQLDAASLRHLPQAVRSAYEHAVVSGAHQAFLLAAAVAVAGFLTAWFLKDVPLTGPSAAAVQRTAATARVTETADAESLGRGRRDRGADG
ncbi:MFS transporter (plasmid) [Streptomyces sp. NBC_01384]|uniref:MDR family MFS transporter n=1 Tax=Streptomyces sp. NBC_01384 TaxID=2903847 RepID=UPI002F9198D9